MNNLLSYCGLVDAKIRASDKDLPVHSKLDTYSIFIFHDFQDLESEIAFVKTRYIPVFIFFETPSNLKLQNHNNIKVQYSK